MLVLICLLALQGQAKTPKPAIHADAAANRPAVSGYKADKPVTRYELAYLLSQFIAHADAAEKQLKSPAESQGVTVPPVPAANATPISYTDIPKSHWASAAVTQLHVQGIDLASGKKLAGETRISGTELATALALTAARVERRKPSAKLTFAALVSEGYLPKEAKLDTKKSITAREATTALGKVLAKCREKMTAISPDSEFAPQK
jgi:hypothetical protein